MYRLVFQVTIPHTNIDGSFFGFSLILIKRYVGLEVGNIPIQADMKDDDKSLL